MNGNQRLADIFVEMAREFKGDRYRKRAYENAADAIRRHDKIIINGTQAQKEIKGIGKSIGAKIDEIIATGRLQFLEDRPQEKIEKERVKQLFEGIHGVGDKTAERWYNMNLRTLADLAKVYHEMSDAQKLGYYYYHQLKERIPRSEIDLIKKYIEQAWKPLGIEYEIGGSYRRGEPTSGDIDIVIKEKPGIFMDTLVRGLGELIIGTLSMGPTKYMGILRLSNETNARRIDMRLVDEQAWPYALLYFTGSKQLNVEMRTKALSLGLTMNEYGMVGPGGTSYPAKTERDIFNYLGIPYLEPTQRAVMFKTKAHITHPPIIQQPTVIQTLSPLQQLMQPAVTPVTQQVTIQAPQTPMIVPTDGHKAIPSELITPAAEPKPEIIQQQQPKVEIRNEPKGKWHRPSSTFFIYVSEGIASTGSIAGFDLDWTLVRTVHGHFPKDADDIALLPNRYSILKEAIQKGMTIAIFTNQKATTENKLTINFNRVNNFIKLISDVPIILFMSTGEDQYRKPSIGMYQALMQMVPPIKSAFYVGDAAGRQLDFSDSDIKFARNIGIPFYTPEKIFQPIERLKPLPRMGLNTLELPQGKNMILFVGMPGVGKTHYYQKYLSNYIHVNQDILGSKTKVLKLTRDSMMKNLSVVIDATNPGQDRRQEFYNMALLYHYNIIVLYFVNDGKERNKLREKPVPTIAYSMYFKNLVEPTPENTPGSLYQVML